LSKDVPCAGARFSCAPRIFLGSQGVPQRELTLEIAAFLRSCDGVPPCRLPSTGARRTGDVAAGIGTQASSRGFSLLICKRCRAPRHAGRPCAPEPLCQVGPTSCIRANPNQRACRALILVHGGMPSPGSRGAHGGKTGLPKGLNGSSTCRGFESGVRGHHRRRRRSHSDRVCVASCRIYVTRPKHVCGAKRAHLRSRCASQRAPDDSGLPSRRPLRPARRSSLSHGSGAQSIARHRSVCNSPMFPLENAGFCSAVVDLDEFCVGPLDRIGRGHALDCLGVHVDDDVFGLHLGCFLIGWPSIARQPTGDRYLLERC